MKNLFLVFSGLVVCCNIYTASAGERRKIRVHWLPVVQALDEIQGSHFAEHGSPVRASGNLEPYMYLEFFR